MRTCLLFLFLLLLLLLLSVFFCFPRQARSLATLRVSFSYPARCMPDGTICIFK
jgi:hypothetical protein